MSSWAARPSCTLLITANFEISPDRDWDEITLQIRQHIAAKNGQIGTAANPIFIDSDVHGDIGDGGIVAWAEAKFPLDVPTA